MKRIADTGLVVAVLTRRDPHHLWAVAQFRNHAPFLVCEAVLSEAASFFPNPLAILKMVARGDLLVDPDFVFAREISQIIALAQKYADLPMDLADACIVRMSELHRESKVWTIDRSDFETYRRHGRQSIPCEFPQ
jgi:predicted nucleic acid-binding protein